MKIFVFASFIVCLVTIISPFENFADTALGAWENQLTTLPESIRQLSALTYLGVSANQLTALPDSISQLYALTQLGVAHNQLTALPKSIRKLSALRVLDVQYNQLTALPDSIGQLSLGLFICKKNYITEVSDSINQRFYFIVSTQKNQTDFKIDASQFIQTYQHLRAQWSAVKKFKSLHSDIIESGNNTIEHLPNSLSLANPEDDLTFKKTKDRLFSKLSMDLKAIDLICKEYPPLAEPVKTYIVSSEAQSLIQRATQLKNSWPHLQGIAHSRRWDLTNIEQQDLTTQTENSTE